MLSLNHGVYIIEKGYKKTVCPDGKYFHQNKLFFIFTLIIFSEHSYFLRKSQITPERKQRKKYFLTPFALHRNIQTARKAFIYGLFRNLVRYSNSQSSICFVVLPCYFSFKTVRFWTVLHIFSTFSFNCIVILLSAICYISKSTNSLKCYNTYTTFQFPYSQEVVENNILLPYLGLPIK